MPSTYTSPDTIVRVERRRRSTPRIVPALAQVYIGNAKQIETRLKVGEFNAGDDLLAQIPGLKPGAVLESDSVQLLLDASYPDGKRIGTFQLATSGVPADAELINGSDSNPANVLVYGNMGLEFSLLSTRNNNLDTADDDAGIGEADGLYMVDDGVDFVSLGVSADASCVVRVTAPGVAAGDYAVRSLLNSGNIISKISLEQVDGSGAKVVNKSLTTNSAQFATAQTRLVGAGAAVSGTHIRLRSASGGNSGFGTGQPNGFGESNFITQATPEANGAAAELVSAVSNTAFGIGVKASLASINTTNVNSILHATAAGTRQIPNAKSSATVWFAPGTGGTAGDGLGTDNATWKNLISKARVGHWLRLVGRFNQGANTSDATIAADYRIAAVDTDPGWSGAGKPNTRLQLVGVDGDIADSSVYTLASTGDVLEIRLLEVLRGAADGIDTAGDYLGVTISGVTTTVEVNRATPYWIETVSAVPSHGVNASGSFVRALPLHATAVSYDLIKRLSTGFGGDVFMSYVAQRNDLALDGLIDIADLAECEEKLGAIHPNNPLSFAVHMAIRGGGATGTVVYALATSGDSVGAFTEALEQLESREDVYALVPISQDGAVIDAVQAHCAAMSQPEQKGERIQFASSPILGVERVYPTDPDAVISGVTFGSENAVPGTRVLAAIPWAEVKVGQMVWTTTATGEKIEGRRIVAINAVGGYAVVAGNNAFTNLTATHAIIETYLPAKPQQLQAEAWRDEAASYGTSRLVMIRPDQAKVTWTDRTSGSAVSRQDVLGMHLTLPAIVGARMALPPQQPVTNLAVGGIDELIHSNLYFTPDQLNTIAEGGGLILTQRARSAPPVIRHQLTTDMSSIETRELSIQFILDFTAKTMRNGLRPYIGRHNITAELLTQLRGTAESLLRQLIDSGVLLEGSRLEKLQQNADRPDEIDIEISLVVPYPCNRINVKLKV